MRVWGGGWGFLHTIKQCCGHKLGILTIQINSDTIYVEIVSDPTLEGFNWTRLLSPCQPPPHPNHTHAFSHQSQARLLPVLLMNWLQVRGSRIPPTLGSINLPKLLTELREMLYLLDHQRRELRKVQMKELLRARYREGAWSFHGRPRAPLSQHPHLSTNPEAVWTQLDFYGGFTA